MELVLSVCSHWMEVLFESEEPVLCKLKSLSHLMTLVHAPKTNSLPGAQYAKRGKSLITTIRISPSLTTGPGYEQVMSGMICIEYLFIHESLTSVNIWDSRCCRGHVQFSDI